MVVVVRVGGIAWHPRSRDEGRRPSQTVAAAGANGGGGRGKSGGGAARSFSSYDKGDERRDLPVSEPSLKVMDGWEDKGLEHPRRVAGGAWSGIAMLVGCIILDLQGFEGKCCHLNTINIPKVATKSQW